MNIILELLFPTKLDRNIEPKTVKYTPSISKFLQVSLPAPYRIVRNDCLMFPYGSINDGFKIQEHVQVGPFKFWKDVTHRWENTAYEVEFWSLNPEKGFVKMMRDLLSKFNNLGHKKARMIIIKQ